ncbi:MAG TPA: CHAD domain-containing protein [Paraburkholderia sp.]
MARVLEIVLNLPEPTVDAWFNENGRLPERIDTAIVQVLGAQPDFEPMRRDDAPFTLCCFDCRHTLAAAGWRITIEASEAVRRVIASHLASYAPGVTIRDTACHVLLAPGEPMSVAFEDVPAALAQRLADAGELATVATLACRRLQWRRVTHGVAVDVVLNIARGVRPDADPAATLRELHLTTLYPEDTGDNGATGDDALRALFAMANELTTALPAFPVLADAIDREGRVDIERNSAPTRAKPIDFSGVRTPHDAFVAIERNIAEQWFGNDAAVRDAPGIEFIHQMRVAQRRLKTVTKIFPAWTDGAWTARIAPRLKWLSDLLGDARDWDVFTDSTLPALARADVDAASWAATRDAANKRRLAARERVQQALRSSTYGQLALAWLEWLSGLVMHGAPDTVRGRSLHSYAKKRVVKHYKRVVREPKLTALDDAARHRVRIHAKRLRYTLEFFEPIASHKTRRAVTKTLSRMQGVLGDGNDAAVALAFLEQLDVEPYQLGFARGWCEASKRHTAKEGEDLLSVLPKPEIIS